MTSFIQKKLPTSKSLPEILKEERINNQFSLDQLSIKTKISFKNLKALEDGNYILLPAEVYIKQFIKKLAKLYRLNEKVLQNIYILEKQKQPSLLNINKNPKTKIKTNFFFSPKAIRYFFIIAVILLFVGYFGFEINNIFTPPKLDIYSPPSQTVTTNSSIEINGKTDPEMTVLINQQKILAELNGNFSQTVDLTIGLNIFTISAGKKHGKPNTITLSILRKPVATAEINLNNQSISLKP